MSHAAISQPDEVIHWFASWPEAQRGRPVLGDCPHARCPHVATTVVGWGPDLAHYELVVCDSDGCQGNCRGWAAAGQYTGIDWKLLGQAR